MKILFLGDYLMDYEGIPDDLVKISNYIEANNLHTILNVEGAIGDGGSKIKKRGPNLKHSEKLIYSLKMLRTKCACLANNHTMDYGKESLLDGLSKMIDSDIACVGAGINEKEAVCPYCFSDGEREIFIFNYGWDVEETVYATADYPGCAPLKRTQILKQIERKRTEKPNGKIILIFHWGFEFNTLPMPLDVDFAHKCVDSGADLIIGHHPHVIQPMEKWHGKKIYYSLGNFYFSSYRDSYPVNFKNEPTNNMCDFGIGVIFDTVTDKCDHIQFVYDRSNKETIITEHVNFLQDITGVEYLTDDYYYNVKKHSPGYNPILGLDDVKNSRDINRLYFKYAISGKISFLKKSSQGQRLYNLIKQMSK